MEGLDIRLPLNPPGSPVPPLRELLMPAPVTKQKRDEMFLAYAARTSLAHVQRSCRVDFRTAQKYREVDAWDRRLATLDEKLTEASLGSVVQMRDDYIRRIRGFLSDFWDRVARKEVNLDPKEAIEFIKAELLLRGQATERKEVGPIVNGHPISEMSDNEVDEALKEMRLERDSLAASNKRQKARGRRRKSSSLSPPETN